MKLTLLHKGLLLVSVPLCFEISIFGVLLHMQDQIEHEAQRVSRNKKITDEINGVVHDVLKITNSFEFDPLTQTPGESPTIFGRTIAIKQSINSTLMRFKDIKELAKDDPALYQKVETCARGMRQAKSDLMEMGRAAGAAPDDKVEGVFKSYRKKLNLDLHDSLSQGLLELGEMSALDTNEVTSPKIRESIRMLLKVALAFSVLFALFGAAMFSKHLASRLSLVGENADFLAKGEPLLPPIGGTDEVAELDSHLHSAADLIEAAKKMRQEVTAMITHDLKAPLQSVRSYLEMLDAGLLGELNPQGQKLLKSTEKASDHMVGLIDSVMQLEKLRTGKIVLKESLVEIAPILLKSIDSISVFAEAKNIALNTEFTEEHFDVSGDEFWLQEVFVNILSNAIKYSPDNSKVFITTRAPDKRTVEVAIRDQGAGIAEAEMKLIFERFHRIAATEGISGTGLGLPIAKELIEMHKGSITVESDGKTGSTFIIRLPLWRPE
ncbi:MAG: HAMP domain-containing histidine kinase [Candidatus Melainabacteria bacterium]|nr:HAMP domain-containing histidine kinase [Candidatus Melainabacteria bacterium]